MDFLKFLQLLLIYKSIKSIITKVLLLLYYYY